MAERTEHLEAVLLSAVRPSQEQEKRFLAFLAEKYGEGTTLTWQKSDDYPDGFRLEVGAEVYDWSAGGRLSQFKDALEKLAATQGDVIPLLKETVLSWTPQAMAQEVGTVLTIGDGIARVDGLEGAAYGEVLLFDGGVRGMVQDLSEDSVGCILFDDDASVCAGSTVCRTGRTAGVPVGEGFLGRDLAAGKGYSEVKAAEIDDEIHRIIEHAYHACEKLLSEHMDEMKRVAEYRIRNETMDGETFVKVYNGEIVPDKIVGEDLMTELQQELHAKVSKPAESAEELAKVEEAEKDLDPDKQDQ